MSTTTNHNYHEETFAMANNIAYDLVSMLFQFDKAQELKEFGISLNKIKEMGRYGECICVLEAVCKVAYYLLPYRS